MAVASCSNCGAPRDPRAARCNYCGAHFVDPETGRLLVSMDDDVEKALQAGRFIEAVKIYKDRHRVGLKQAKEAVEQLERRLKV